YMVIEGIKSILQNCDDMELVGYASNASSCLAFIKQQQPDVILMDISMPDKNGIELCQEVKNKFPIIKVLGLSTFDQKVFVDKMMESGASGYVLKNATKQELTKAIREVSLGHKYLSITASDALKSAQHDKTTIPFATRREKEVLLLIAEGFTNNEIGVKLSISAGTVDKHRKSLLAKYEVKNTAALVRFATINNLI
ncbi:MAG: response regulator transcription factor, partial [Cyclobacteriaceae bacterium]|nr:response regulator transcription factor [Cyclobacteriaceae bacterium]